MVKQLMQGYAPEGAKRRYEAHFLSKLTDCDGLRLVAYRSERENSETDSSLDFALECGYISREEHHAMTIKCAEVGRMLYGIMNKFESFLIHNEKSDQDRAPSDVWPLTSDI
jgi:four helix bundle protein